ncbi:MAG: Coenzyme F420 hydrogenase/dehydrogenase, beta subunit C-terminal domain [Desulfobacterales bacterium]|nr:Coenzyme F420 hydrogenase/dehydrogenase, beta subunit C-terminal domain [Desulfobacterales bacterium]
MGLGNLSNSQSQISNWVLKHNLCVVCGACVGICPYFNYIDGKVMLMDFCTQETGKCHQICPKLVIPDVSSSEAFEMQSSMGTYKDIVMARAADEHIRQHAQYGGFTTAMLIYALQKAWIEGAVLTNKGDENSSTGIFAKTPNDILACSGSRFNGSASLSVFNRCLRDNQKKIAIVGLPCQLIAVSQMENLSDEGEAIKNSIALKLGLFCTWALDFRRLREYLKKQGIHQRILKYDIPPPPEESFKVLTESGWIQFPLQEIRQLIQYGCTSCLDMTAEASDISVGMAENQAGWNTVMIRTQRGFDLFSQAVQEGVIETCSIPEANRIHLQEASLSKKKRGFNQFQTIRSEL